MKRPLFPETKEFGTLVYGGRAYPRRPQDIERFRINDGVIICYPERLAFSEKTTLVVCGYEITDRLLKKENKIGTALSCSDFSYETREVSFKKIPKEGQSKLKGELEKILKSEGINFDSIGFK